MFQRPSLPGDASASSGKERRGSPKGCPEEVRGRGLPGRRPHPSSGATSSPERQDEGVGGKPGRGPRRLGRGSAQGLIPPGRGSPRGAALVPTPRHLSQLGWQRNPRTVPGQRERAPSYSTPRCSTA